MGPILLAIIAFIPGGLLGFGAGYYFARRSDVMRIRHEPDADAAADADASNVSEPSEPAPAMPKTFKGATLAAALAASFAAGQGTFGHVIVEGEAPADSAGWECEVVGPALSGVRVCRPFAAVGGEPERLTAAPPKSSPPDACEWKAKIIEGVEVMQFLCGEADKEQENGEH